METLLILSLWSVIKTILIVILWTTGILILLGAILVIFILLNSPAEHSYMSNPEDDDESYL